MSSAGSVTVDATYMVYSLAQTGPAGGLSANVKNGTFNMANAKTSVSGNAGFGSDGSLTVHGNVTVTVNATADAIAQVRAHDLSISGYYAAVNWVKADLTAVQNA